MRWPFPDAEAFWVWATDPDAELAEQDEDLLLHDPAGLPLLVAAADDPDCPKRDYCANVLEDYARQVVSGDRYDEYPALRAAAARASTGRDARTRAWAAYVTRVSGYRDRSGPMNRATAEQMAVDLLIGPTRHRRMAKVTPHWPTVRLAANQRHWECVRPDSYPEYLYIDRRTGHVRRSAHRPLSAAELAERE